MTEEATIRMVAGREMLPAAEFLAAKGYPVPNPILAVAWIAERDGKVIGVLSLDALPTISAIRVDDESQTSRIGLDLFNAARNWIESNQEIPRVYAHTAHPTMKKMLQSAGANNTGEEYFVWERA